jgi:hypothetical protein
VAITICAMIVQAAYQHDFRVLAAWCITGAVFSAALTLDLSYLRMELGRFLPGIGRGLYTAFFIGPDGKRYMVLTLTSDVDYLYSRLRNDIHAGSELLSLYAGSAVPLTIDLEVLSHAIPDEVLAASSASASTSVQEEQEPAPV